MSITLSSRRTFLQATVSGGAVLPLLTSLGMATNAVAGGLVEAEGSLCLFEADAAMGADMAAGVRQIGLAYQTVTLDDAAGWSAMLDALTSARGRSLAVLGRSATVFAVRSMLEPTWRVVLEGRHSRQADSGMRHELSGLDAPMRSLSGGNQQKVILGRELAAELPLLILDQPTRGLDVSAADFVHNEILAQRDLGRAILLVSSDLEELLALADRVLVLHRGRLAGSLPIAEATIERVGRLMLTGSDDAS